MKPAPIFWVLLFFFVYCPSSSADYPSAKPNEDLAKEVRLDNDRIVSPSEHFAFAADGIGAYRTLSGVDYFHGIHYWLQLRSEARVNDYLVANLRTVLYAGSDSYGYARPTGFYNLLGVTGTLPYSVAGGTLRTRALDLGRQTTGVGLLIQDKEMNGAHVTWNHGDAEVQLRAEGTGTFMLRDDTLNFEVSLFDRLLGAELVAWDGEGHGPYRKPYLGLYSAHEIYDLEVGLRNNSFAGLAALKTRQTLASLQVDGRIESRWYASGFAENIAGQVQQQYVSYDQLDKPYTNAINVFVTGDDVRVFAGHLDLRWRLSHDWRLESLNECGVFEFVRGPSQTFYYFRQGVGYSPIPGRDDLLTLYVSNKVIADNSALPPTGISQANAPLFMKYFYAGLEGKFRF